MACPCEWLKFSKLAFSAKDEVEMLLSQVKKECLLSTYPRAAAKRRGPKNLHHSHIVYYNEAKGTCRDFGDSNGTASFKMH